MNKRKGPPWIAEGLLTCRDTMFRSIDNPKRDCRFGSRLLFGSPLRLMLAHVVDQPVLLCFLRAQPVVAISIRLDLFVRLAGMVGHVFVDARLQLENFFILYLHFSCLSLRLSETT